MPDLIDAFHRATSPFRLDVPAVWTVLLLASIAVAVAAFLPRRRLLTGAAGVALAVVVGVTITPFGGWGALGFETGALRSVVTNLEPHRSALTGWFANPDGPANVVLFVPAGFLVALLLRRPLVSAAALTALSFAVECWQATLTTRVGSFDDVVANGLGAAIGTAAAAIVLAATTVARRPRPTTAPPSGSPTRPLSHVG